MFAKVTRPSASVIQISAGALSARWRKRVSLSRRRASARFRSPMPRATVASAATRPAPSLIGKASYQTGTGSPVAKWRNRISPAHPRPAISPGRTSAATKARSSGRKKSRTVASPQSKPSGAPTMRRAPSLVKIALPARSAMPMKSEDCSMSAR